MNQELKNLQYEIEEMNLLRNLRIWKHNAVKLSEQSVVKTLKKENVELVESIAKYKKQLQEKGDSVETDKDAREAKLQSFI